MASTNTTTPPHPADHDVELHDFSDLDSASPRSMSASSHSSFSKPPSSSATSYSSDAEMRSLSPAPSVYSMTNSLREQSYRVEFGRSLNNHSDVYRLPADPEELDRLDKQHDMFALVMGKYPSCLHDVLGNDDPTTAKSCLDLGCGSGSWIMEVAREFPNSSCVAVDLVPMQSLTIPPNCRSEVDDINLGLEHLYGDYDVVHARLINSGIKDYYKLIDQSSQVVRPGGLVDFTEWDFRMYDMDKQPITPSYREIYGLDDSQPSHERDSSKAWLPRWYAALGQAARRRGGHIDAASLMHNWIADHKEFEDVVCREFWFPSSPWMFDIIKSSTPGDDTIRYQPNKLYYEKFHCFETGSNQIADPETLFRVCNRIREDGYAFLRSGRLLLLSSGMPEDVVDRLQENATRELMEAKIPVMARIRNVYARRKRT